MKSESKLHERNNFFYFFEFNPQEPLQKKVEGSISELHEVNGSLTMKKVKIEVNLGLLSMFIQ